MTVAYDCCEGWYAYSKFEHTLACLLAEYHKDVNWDFTFDFDASHNIAIIYFEQEMPEGWVPCNAVAEGVFKMGFSGISWWINNERIRN